MIFGSVGLSQFYQSLYICLHAKKTKAFGNTATADLHDSLMKYSILLPKVQLPDERD